MSHTFILFFWYFNNRCVQVMVMFYRDVALHGVLLLPFIWLYNKTFLSSICTSS